MRKWLKVFLISGALLAPSLAQTATASAASQPLTIDTGSYTCTNGVCDLGPATSAPSSQASSPPSAAPGRRPTPGVWSPGAFPQTCC